MISFLSDELNYLIYRYLQESGFHHSAYVFGNEAKTLSSNINSANIPIGSLVVLVQKGLLYTQVEYGVEKNIDFVTAAPQLSLIEALTCSFNDETSNNNNGDVNNSTTISSTANATTMTLASSVMEDDVSAASTCEVKAVGEDAPCPKATVSEVAVSSSATDFKKPSDDTNDCAVTTVSDNTDDVGVNKDEKMVSSTVSSIQQVTQSIIVATTVSKDGKVVDNGNSAANLISNISTGSALNVTICNSSPGALSQQPLATNLSHYSSCPEVTVSDGKSGFVKTFRGHTDDVFVCAWNPVKDILATGSGDATARLWNANEPSQGVVLYHDSANQVVSEPGSQDVTSIDWNADGSKIATGSYDGFARIWSHNGKRLKVMGKHCEPIFALKWNKRSDYILSGGVDRTTIVWDANSGTCIQQFSLHTRAVLDVDWQTNSTFASCSSDLVIYVCTLGQEKPIKVFKGHTSEVNAIRWNPNATLLASCSDDKTLKIWSMAENKFSSTTSISSSPLSSSPGLLCDIPAHEKEVYTIKWSPCGPGTLYPNQTCYLASASFDSTVKLWDLETVKNIYSLEQHTLPVYSLAFSPDGRYLASGSLDKKMHIWSTSTGKLVHTFVSTDGIYEVVWNIKGDKIGISARSGYVFVLDTRNFATTNR